MAFGTGPQALVELFETTWQESRTGRDDVPPIIKRKTGSEDPDLTNGVLAVRDRQDVAWDQARHDLIHCYHPEGGPFSITDTGFREQNVTETVQVDVQLTDRTDQATDQRLSATNRMVSDRASVADLDDPPYPGVFGETKYILETVRRDLDEYDRVSHEVINFYLGNSNANVSFNVEMERLAANTVQ
jgi:hypothetical protein